MQMLVDTVIVLLGLGVAWAICVFLSGAISGFRDGLDMEDRDDV